MPAKGSRKEYCCRGHLRAPENLVVSSGNEKCRECHREHSRRAYWRKKGVESADSRLVDSGDLVFGHTWIDATPFLPLLGSDSARRISSSLGESREMWQRRVERIRREGRVRESVADLICVALDTHLSLIGVG